MKLVTGRHGRLRMRLDPAERQLLIDLLDDFDGVLAGGVDAQPGAHAADGAVRSRLFPAAYRDDVDAAAEYRELTESGLRDERTDRVAACRAELGAARTEIELSDPDVARRWIQVVNDLRLTHGTRLGVTEDDDADQFDPRDPDQHPRLIYYWLTAVQDTVVTALMG